jgi:hypothetical protein
MRNPVAVALVVMGGLVILGPVLAGAYSRSANKEIIAEFYRRHGLQEELPEAMRPAGSGLYAWACWLAGTGMVMAGVWFGRGLPAGLVKPAEPGAAADGGAR